MLPSLPVSILKLHVSTFWLFIFVFIFVIVTDLILWILNTFDLTSNSCGATSLSSSSWHGSWIALHLPTQAPAYSHLESSCHRLGTSGVHVCFHSIPLFFYSGFFHSVEMFAFFFGLSAFWALCASTYLALANTCPLVTSSVFLIVVSSLIISVIMSLSFILFVNCSINCLFLCTHIHLPSFRGEPSITWYFHFVLLLVHNIVMTKLVHYIGA